MGLADLTHPHAVERALSEFDDLGRDPFLSKYGFGRSRSYFVLRDGKPYDSKAIAGAAHGYQHPALGPLKPSDFSGGDATVRARLEALGFTVVVTEPRTTPLRPLVLFGDYHRREVHDIFAPGTAFTSGAGLWGLQGIIEYQPREFVLFVTFGRQQGDHVFDEGITIDGVVTWQSQPNQTLDSPQVKQLMAHDPDLGNVRLFLRTRDRSNSGEVTPYTYLGRLSYLTHDSERERPVHFQWQIVEDWPPSTAVLARMALVLTGEKTSPPTSVVTLPRLGPVLTETAAPSHVNRVGARTSDFRARKSPDRSAQDARNRQLGLAGELAVVESEQRRLRDAGRSDLAGEVRHVSVIEGDGAGYDVKSFELDGSPRFIEVKTTRGGVETDFFVSANEVQFSKQHAQNYCLYRVYAFDMVSSTGSFYMRHGSLEAHPSIDLAPTVFRARIRS